MMHCLPVLDSLSYLDISLIWLAFVRLMMSFFWPIACPVKKFWTNTKFGLFRRSLFLEDVGDGEIAFGQNFRSVACGRYR